MTPRSWRWHIAMETPNAGLKLPSLHQQLCKAVSSRFLIPVSTWTVYIIWIPGYSLYVKNETLGGMLSKKNNQHPTQREVELLLPRCLLFSLFFKQTKKHKITNLFVHFLFHYSFHTVVTYTAKMTLQNYLSILASEGILNKGRGMEYF